MPIIRTEVREDQVKVAVVFDAGKVLPRWFEVPGRERVQIQQICSVWETKEGNARIVVFEVYDGHTLYQLRFNTLSLSWGLAETIID